MRRFLLVILLQFPLLVFGINVSEPRAYLEIVDGIIQGTTIALNDISPLVGNGTASVEFIRKASETFKFNITLYDKNTIYRWKLARSYNSSCDGYNIYFPNENVSLNFGDLIWHPDVSYTVDSVTNYYLIDITPTSATDPIFIDPDVTLLDASLYKFKIEADTYKFMDVGRFANPGEYWDLVHGATSELYLYPITIFWYWYGASMSQDEDDYVHDNQGSNFNYFRYWKDCDNTVAAFASQIVAQGGGEVTGSTNRWYFYPNYFYQWYQFEDFRNKTWSYSKDPLCRFHFKETGQTNLTMWYETNEMQPSSSYLSTIHDSDVISTISNENSLAAVVPWWSSSDIEGGLPHNIWSATSSHDLSHSEPVVTANQDDTWICYFPITSDVESATDSLKLVAFWKELSDYIDWEHGGLELDERLYNGVVIESSTAGIYAPTIFLKNYYTENFDINREIVYSDDELNIRERSICLEPEWCDQIVCATDHNNIFAFRFSGDEFFLGADDELSRSRYLAKDSRLYYPEKQSKGNCILHTTCDNLQAMVSPEIGPAGTINGSTTTLQFSSAKFNNGYRTTNSTDYISYPASLINGTSGAVSLWIRPVNFNDDSYADFLDSRTTTNAQGIVVYWDRSNQNFAFYLQGSIATVNIPAMPRNWVNTATDELFHIACVWDNNGFGADNYTQAIYINGRLENWSNTNQGAIDAPPLTVGRNIYGNVSLGYIDNIKIYDEAVIPYDFIPEDEYDDHIVSRENLNFATGQSLILQHDLGIPQSIDFSGAKILSSSEDLHTFSVWIDNATKLSSGNAIELREISGVGQILKVEINFNNSSEEELVFKGIALTIPEDIGIAPIAQKIHLGIINYPTIYSQADMLQKHGRFFGYKTSIADYLKDL